MLCDNNEEDEDSVRRLKNAILSSVQTCADQSRKNMPSQQDVPVQRRAVKGYNRKTQLEFIRICNTVPHAQQQQQQKQQQVSSPWIFRMFKSEKVRDMLENQRQPAFMWDEFNPVVSQEKLEDFLRMIYKMNSCEKCKMFKFDLTTVVLQPQEHKAAVEEKAKQQHPNKKKKHKNAAAAALKKSVRQSILMCSLCLESFQIQQEAEKTRVGCVGCGSHSSSIAWRRLVCGHVIHSKCLDKMGDNKSCRIECPKCKKLQNKSFCLQNIDFVDNVLVQR